MYLDYERTLEFGNDDIVYNREFKKEELLYCLGKAKETTPGNDQISYSMIKNLPNHALEHLLKIFNKF